MTDYIGQQFGNYRLLHRLGEGSFATVYLAEHRYLEIPAAIKILHLQMDPTAHEQFRREAYTIAHLQHPHIIRVLDFGIQDQIPYLVMEYMPKGTLRTLHPRGTSLPLEQIVIYVKQIASALDYAHQQRVIHRDIKPDNILLGADNNVGISDFGLALVQQSLNTLSTHQLAGTPLYIAPEQIQRKPCAASDQYALGVIVYEWIAGKTPFQGSIFELLNQHLYQPPPGLCMQMPHINIAVEEAVFGALAKDPRKRFPTVQDFASVLEEACITTQSLPRPSLQHKAPLWIQDTHPLQPTIPTPASIAPVQALAATWQLSTTPLPVTQPSAMQPSLSPRSPTTTLSQRNITHTNRQRLLQRVRAFWIEGVLQHSLYGATLLTLGLTEQPHAVANPWHMVLRHPDTTPHPIPTGTRITQVYDTCNGELLILGAPGCGKTTLLLELARDLLKRAQDDEQHPLPVIFNLSTWSLKHLPLTDWFTEELTSKYQVPRKLARMLVEREQLLPLLDGLDEAAPQERSACIKAINSYRQEHGLLPLVVCSRLADYLAQDARVQLGSAVVVQPLTTLQIDSYLATGGVPLQALRVALQQDAGLQDLARTPLMLNILMLTYRNISVEQLLRIPSQEGRQRYIFDHYVKQTFTRRGSETTRYTFQQTTHWLSWLARQLVGHNQTIFHIERMQPNWLEDELERQRYPQIVSGCIFGLLAALFLGPSGALFFTKSGIGLFLIASIVSVAGNGLLFGLLNGLLYDEQEGTGEQHKKQWSWRRIWTLFLHGALNGCLLGTLFGLPIGYAEFRRAGPDPLPLILGIGIVYSFLGGLLFLLVDRFIGVRMIEIRLTETFAWSWIRMGRNLVKFLIIGILISVGIVFLYELFHRSYLYATGGMKDVQSILQGALLEGAQIMPFLAPITISICGLLGALTGGMSSTILDARYLTMPNQGIHLSARHSILIGFIGTIVGSVVGMQLDRSHDPKLILAQGFLFGLLIGLTSGLRAGGAACIQHLILRWRLWKSGVQPWNYAHFLDYAADHVLLCKIGGGYIFMHRLLLEYFASLDTSSQDE